LTDKDVIIRSERPYVNGFMDHRFALVFHTIMNQDTDLMCVVHGTNPSIPLTYGFYDPREMLRHGKRYPLKGRPNVGTSFFMNFTRPDTYGQYYSEDFSALAFVEIIDMKHGRRAKGHLYPLVINGLRQAHAALNAVGVKIESPP
jgi:hypothetical protein